MDLWYGTSGPRSARIAIVGEAWGVEEARASRPFVGSSGQELNRMLLEVGISRDDCFTTNVAALRPLNNQMWRLFAPRSAGVEEFHGLHPLPETLDEIKRMGVQLAEVNPDIIIAVGNWALWALTDSARVSYKSSDERGPMEGGGRMIPSGIGDFRGSMLWSRYAPKPVLPIIHPAAILREWSWRDITLHDLRNRVPMALEGRWNVPLFDIKIRPSLYDLRMYLSPRIHKMDRGALLECSIDIETMACDSGFRTITCISLCTEPNKAITFPLIDKDSDGNFISYWGTPSLEAYALRELRRFLSHPNLRAIGQNFLYDQSYILDHWFIVPRLAFDTMLAHHLLWPGTPKDLGYLSSIYCEHHRYWKDDNRDWGAKASPDTHYLYNAEDVIRTFEIAGKQRDLITKLGLSDLWAEEIEKQELAFEMMTRGIKVDLKARSTLTIQMIQAAEEHQAALLTLIPQAWVDDLMGKKNKTFWFNSTKQTPFVLYDILKIPPQRNRKTGNNTTDAKAMEVLRSRSPTFRLLFELLENMRSIGTLTSNVLRAPLDPDGRMRSSFNTGGTETFRWSSSENPFGRGTNLQNITSGED